MPVCCEAASGPSESSERRTAVKDLERMSSSEPRLSSLGLRCRAETGMVGLELGVEQRSSAPFTAGESVTDVNPAEFFGTYNRNLHKLWLF